MSTEDNLSPETIVTLRIDLIDSDPPIWREVEVPTAITLRQLHTIVQAAMEWEDAHLWEFTIGREPIGSSRATKLTLQDLLRPRVTRLLYTYDMGDCWEHQLTLTKPRAADPALTYPRYISGENPAPPEDCGGIPGFYAQIEALADPNHPDHDDAKEWFGDFDPNHFDAQPIKDRLARIANRRPKASAKTKLR
ncbi:MAG: plasmid pRiA4b ORF-3 family protein [Alphaproteobacteria bacterium]|nr:plasmid pRiA4b ORF-3 family protein [Alphaproteobacteria bacterium]